MATWAYTGGIASKFTPISAGLQGLPNGAGTIAILARLGTITGGRDMLGLTNAARSLYYHGLGWDSSLRLFDDDGQTGPVSTTTFSADASGGDNFRIWVVDWPSGGAAPERFHWSSTIASAESWTHEASGNNGGNRAGPDSTGTLLLGNIGDYNNFSGEIALIGIWAGVRLSDANVLDLWVNKKTSDWYNHAAGHPTTLIEYTSATPTDIGADPSTFSTIGNGAMTGPDPTGWTFDGQGVSWPPAGSENSDRKIIVPRSARLG